MPTAPCNTWPKALNRMEHVARLPRLLCWICMPICINGMSWRFVGPTSQLCEALSQSPKAQFRAVAGSDQLFAPPADGAWLSPVGHDEICRGPARDIANTLNGRTLLYQTHCWPHMKWPCRCAKQKRKPIAILFFSISWPNQPVHPAAHTFASIKALSDTSLSGSSPL